MVRAVPGVVVDQNLWKVANNDGSQVLDRFRTDRPVIASSTQPVIHQREG
jgi:hypothetical protein